MEFPFDIRQLFPEEYVKVDNRLLPVDIWNERNRWSNEDLKQMQANMRVVLDDMGNASAFAQQLHQVITNADRLKQSDHFLYFMRDVHRPAMIGFLKIGPKKLFVYDQNGAQHEKLPMCVLDFYVHESRQRTGCGRAIFEHMLLDLGIRPHHLAVDRPSDKFLQFLRKHYGLTHSIPQINNFMVFQGFFDGQVDWTVGLESRRHSATDSAAPTPNGTKSKGGGSGIQLEDTNYYTPRLPFCRQVGKMGGNGGVTPSVGSALGQGVAGLGSGVGRRTTMAQIMGGEDVSENGDGVRSYGGSGRASGEATPCPHSPVSGRKAGYAYNQNVRSDSLAVQLSECTMTPRTMDGHNGGMVPSYQTKQQERTQQQHQQYRPRSPSPSPTPASSPAPHVTPPLSASPPQSHCSSPTPFRDLKFAHQRLW